MSSSKKQQPSLPDSLSPCANVRRSCSMLMGDKLCPSFHDNDNDNDNYGAGTSTTCASTSTCCGSRSVMIDSTNAMNDLADKISNSIIEKYQQSRLAPTSATTATTTITTTTTTTTTENDNDNATAAISEDLNVNVNVNVNVNECIDNLDFASWDADGWHYTGMNYSRPHISKEEEDKQRFERVALYVMVLDCINFCFWPVDGSDGSASGSASGSGNHGRKALTNLLEYEHLASALKKIAEADDVLPQQQQQEEEKGELNSNPYITSTNTSTVAENTVTKAETSYAFAPQNLIHLNTKKLLEILHLGQPEKKQEQEQEEENNKDSHKDDDDNNDALSIYSVPNVDERCRLIIEVGESLLTFHCGSATNFISKANKSADMLVHLILQSFPGFRDTAVLNGRWVAFYKRAQILVADLWAALGGVADVTVADVADVADVVDEKKVEKKTCINHCYFYDMDKITTFADYRVPQLLRHLNVMQYSPELSRQVDDKIELVPFCADELYIRAATVVAVDELVDRVKTMLREKCMSNSDDDDNDSNKFPLLVGLQAENVNAVKMDWYLWNIGEKLDRNKSLGPHHRVKTIFY